MDARIQELLNRVGVDEALATYCRGIDRHDTDVINAAYFPDAYDNHGPFQDIVSNGFAAWGNDLHTRKSSAHMHNLTTRWVEVQGDVAIADTYIIFGLLLKDEPKVSIGSGRYVDRLERRDGEWRIARRETAIDIRFLADASAWQQVGGGYPKGCWDRSDLAYSYPFDLSAELRAALLAKGPPPKRDEFPLPHDLEARPQEGEKLLEWMVARRGISDQIANSLRGLDRQSRPLIESTFAPGARITVGSVHLDLDSHIDREFSEGTERDGMQARHVATQNVVVAGEEAMAETYVIDMRRRKGNREVWVGGLRLMDRLVKHGDSWLILERLMIGDWEFLADTANFDPGDGYLRSTRADGNILRLDARDQDSFNARQGSGTC